MNCVIMIPARYDSSRFPGKPLALINGKPMIQHVYERCAAWGKAVLVIVCTDNVKIVDAVAAIGGTSYLSTEPYISGTDRIAGCVREMGFHSADLIINVQGDEPLITSAALDQLVAPFEHRMALQMSTLRHKVAMEDEPWQSEHVVKVVVDRNNLAMYFSRCSIPYGGGDVWWRHIGVYAYRRQFLLDYSSMPVYTCEMNEQLEQLRALENCHSIYVAETNYQGIGVDIPEDIARVEPLL